MPCSTELKASLCWHKRIGSLRKDLVPWSWTKFPTNQILFYSRQPNWKNMDRTKWEYIKLQHFKRWLNSARMFNTANGFASLEVMRSFYVYVCAGVRKSGAVCMYSGAWAHTTIRSNHIVSTLFQWCTTCHRLVLCCVTYQLCKVIALCIGWGLEKNAI